MQHYREHVIPTQHGRPRQWYLGFAMVVVGVLIALYGLAGLWDAASDARVLRIR